MVLGVVVSPCESLHSVSVPRTAFLHVSEISFTSVCAVAKGGVPLFFGSGTTSVTDCAVTLLLASVHWREDRPSPTTEVIDFRSVAGSKASEDMFVGHPESSVHGGMSVAVPGEIQGMWDLHQQYGTLPWHELVCLCFLACRRFRELNPLHPTPSFPFQLTPPFPLWLLSSGHASGTTGAHRVACNPVAAKEDSAVGERCSFISNYEASLCSRWSPLEGGRFLQSSCTCRNTGKNRPRGCLLLLSGRVSPQFFVPPSSFFYVFVRH